MLGLAPVVLEELGVDECGDDGHEDGLRAPLPEEGDQSGLVADDGPQEELHVGLLEGPAADIYHVLLL